MDQACLPGCRSQMKLSLWLSWLLAVSRAALCTRNLHFGSQSSELFILRPSSQLPGPQIAKAVEKASHED